MIHINIIIAAYRGYYHWSASSTLTGLWIGFPLITIIIVVAATIAVIVDVLVVACILVVSIVAFILPWS